MGGLINHKPNEYIIKGKKYIKYYNTKEEAIEGRKLLEKLYTKSWVS